MKIIRKPEIIKAVLLDVDGTLFSSEDIILETYKKEFIKYKDKNGVPDVVPDLPDIMRQIGKPVVEIFLNLAPELKKEQQAELSGRILISLVESIRSGGGQYYDGIQETCRYLRQSGYMVFAASNGRYPYIEAILQTAGIFEFFKEIPFVNNVTIKNKDELVAHILVKHQLQPSEALVVGDRLSDRNAAKSNNCLFAACLYGHGTMDELEDADVYIDSFGELMEYLKPAQLT